MSEERPTPVVRCAFCEYNLAGLPSSTCPECGGEQPPPTSDRGVRPDRWVRGDRILVVIALVGMVAFALLSKIATVAGTGLGVEYTGNQELVGFTVGFGMVAAVYAVVGFEMFFHRAKFRRVRSGTLAAVGMVMIFGGFLAFAVVFMAMMVRWS